MKSQSPIASYVLSFAFVALAALLRLAFDPWLGERAPYLTFVAAVLAAAWYGGSGPSIVAVLISLLLATFFFVPPVGSVLLPSVGDAVGSLLFLSVGVGVAVFSRRARSIGDKIRDERERFYVTLASIGDGVIVIDKQGDVTFLNAAAESLTGRSGSEAIGRPLEAVFQIFDEHSRDALANPALKSLRSASRADAIEKAVLVDKDGAERIIENRAALIHAANGKVDGAVLIFRDVTQRDNAERALRESEQRFRTMADSAPVLIWLADVDGRCYFVNKRWLDFTGRTLDEQAGDRWTEGVHAEDIQKRLEVYRAAFNGKAPFEMEYRLRRFDGRFRWVMDRGLPLFGLDGAFQGFVGSCVDITQMKEAQEAVRLSERRFRLLFEASPLGVFVVGGVEGELLQANPAFGKMLGYSRDELSRMDLDSLIHPKDDPWRLPEAAESWEEEVTFTTEKRLIAKDGRPLWTRLSGRVIFDEQQRPLFAVVTAEEITERIEAERRRGAQLAANQILAREQDAAAALPKLLAAAGGALRWEAGCFWRPEDAAGTLRCTAVWTAAAVKGPFASAVRDARLENGGSLAGRVWVTQQAIWADDVAALAGSEQEKAAARSGLHAAFACPVTIGDRQLGVIEFFSDRVREIDESLLEAMTAIGSQIGQFLDRTQAQETLRRSEERFRLLMEQAADAILIADSEGRNLEINESACRMLGYSRDEILQMRIVDLVSPEDVPRLIESEAALRKGRSQRMEWNLLRKDGRWVPVEINARLLPDGRCQAIVRDVARRKRTEATLRFLSDASQALASLLDYESALRHVAAMATPGFADWCRIDMLSPKGERKTLAATASENGRHANDDFNEIAEGSIRAVMANGRTERFERGDAVDRNGSEAHDAAADQTHSLLCVALSAHGRVMGALCFAMRPGRKFTDEDFNVAEDLAGRASIAVENARLYQQVKDADRRKDEFLAMLAHELRNPLAPIRTGLDLLAMGDASNDTLQLMHQQVDHLVRLVDDLLDVSRIMRGKVELRCEPVRLEKLIRQSVDAIRPGIERKGQRLVVDVGPAEDLWLDADAVRIIQVVENLLTNASKYSDANGRIELTVQRQGETAVVLVRDDGVGIEPELLPKVFDLFTQSSRSLDRADGGLGIGLTLAKSLVERHGGTIVASSDGPGKGSEFRISLPLTSPPYAAVSPKAPTAAERSRKVLIVDDNADAARMLAMLVSRLGPHETEIAYDGPSTIEAARAFQPDLLLLDIGLPGMDGYEVVRRLREAGDCAGAVKVALTGYGQEEDRQKAMQAGFDVHIVKPVDLEALGKLLVGAEAV